MTSHEPHSEYYLKQRRQKPPLHVWKRGWVEEQIQPRSSLPGVLKTMKSDPRCLDCYENGQPIYGWFRFLPMSGRFLIAIIKAITCSYYLVGLQEFENYYWGLSSLNSNPIGSKEFVWIMSCSSNGSPKSRAFSLQTPLKLVVNTFFWNRSWKTKLIMKSAFIMVKTP